MQEMYKNAFKKASNFINTISTRVKSLSYNTVLGILIGLAVTVFIIDINVDTKGIYAVKVKDKTIGYTQSKDAYKKVLASIKATDGNEVSKELSAEKTSGEPAKQLTAESTSNEPAKYLSEVELEKMVRQELKLNMPALVVYADGVEIVKVDSQESLDKVIKGVEEYYYPKVENGTYTITSAKVKENITTSTAIVNPDEILDVNEAVEKIVSGRGAKKTYKIVQNDTMWDIAIRNGISIEDIEAANPGVNMEKLKIDQEINLAVNLPYINVEIAANIKAKETVPFETEKVVDKALAKGASNVKQEGKDGITEVEKNVVILNGDVTQEDVVSSKVLTAAVDKILAVGEKEKVVVASGNFMRPSRGVFTSGFGARWGRQHTGVDLASPTGTPILAADAGTVSFAGRNGTYGLCIIINHGNGYQTLYGHSSKLLVKVGQKVAKGEKIALVGSTGRSTGPHLHFEVRKNGVPQNPLRYIK